MIGSARGTRIIAYAEAFSPAATMEEREAELYEAKITALAEDNENLQSQHDELTRTHNVSKEQISKLLKEKASWKEKHLQLMAKRPREEDSEPVSAKRVAEDRPDSTPVAPEDNEMGSADVTSSPTNMSNILDTSNTLSTSNTSHASGTPLPPPPWGAPPLPAEISDRRKKKFKRDLDLDFDPWSARLAAEDEAEVTLTMRKAEVKRSFRYDVPDYLDDKLTRYRIMHDGNIKVGVKARDDFNRSTTTWSYNQKVEDQHEGYIKFQQRNYIPRVVSNYWRILNDPPLCSVRKVHPDFTLILGILQGLPWLRLSCAPELPPWSRVIKRQIITYQIIKKQFYKS
jgi:hypothetical protein